MLPDPAAADDDALAEFLADCVIAEVCAAYPGADAVFRRRAARLMLAQLTGRYEPPGAIPMTRIAAAFRLPQQRLSEILATAQLRARIAYIRKHGTPPEFQ